MTAISVIAASAPNQLPGPVSPHYVSSAGSVRIAYDVEGSGPPLVLLHPHGKDRYVWRMAGLVGRFAEHFTVVSLDLRGYGASDKPEHADSYAAQAFIHDVHAAVDACCPGRQFAVWGAGLGGAIGLQVAEHSPRIYGAAIAGAYFGQVAPRDLVDRAGSKAHAALADAMIEWPAVRPGDLRCRTLVFAGARNAAVARKLHGQEDAMKDAFVQFVIFPELDAEQEILANSLTYPLVDHFLRNPVVP